MKKSIIYPTDADSFDLFGKTALQLDENEPVGAKIRLTVKSVFEDENDDPKSPCTASADTVVTMSPNAYYHGLSVNALEDVIEENEAIQALMGKIPNDCLTENDPYAEKENDHA